MVVSEQETSKLCLKALNRNKLKEETFEESRSFLLMIKNLDIKQFIKS